MATGTTGTVDTTKTCSIGNNINGQVGFNIQPVADDENNVQIRIDLGGGYFKYIAIPDADRPNFNKYYNALHKTLNVNNEKEFCLSVTTMTVSWLNAAGEKETKGVLEGANLNPKLVKKAHKLQAIVKKLCPHLSITSIDTLEKAEQLKGRKSFSDQPAMNRSNHEVLKNLPTNFSQSAKYALEIYSKAGHGGDTDIDNALKRIAARERVMKKHFELVQAQQTGTLQELMTESTKLKDPTTTDADKPQIKLKIEALQKKLAKLAEFSESEWERVGLYVAAAFAPESDKISTLTEEEQLKAASDAAEQACEALAGALADGARSQAGLPSWMPDLLRGSPQLDPELKAYSVDAAALIFSILPTALARKGVQQFYEAHGLTPKAHSLEDDAMRLAHKKGQGEYKDRAGAEYPEMRAMEQMLDTPGKTAFETENKAAKKSIKAIAAAAPSDIHSPVSYWEKANALFEKETTIEKKIQEVGHLHTFS
jgi:hypothetical protein